jgi:SAM-dependent methyltransferase
MEVADGLGRAARARAPGSTHLRRGGRPLRSRLAQFLEQVMAAFAAEMWRLVRPGGHLAITTWGPDLFEPANGIFWESVRAVEPALAYCRLDR